MDYKRKASGIIRKFKKEHNVTTTVSSMLVDTIAESLQAIESAKSVMVVDAERTKKNDPKCKAGYGFVWSRFGELKKHPGRDIIRDENKKILENLKALSVSSSLSPEDEKPKGTLKNMMRRA